MTPMGAAFAAVPNEDLAFLGTEPIPAGPYYRQDYFDLEREAVFRRTWLQIGRVSEVSVPGSYIVREVEIAKASVLVVHGMDGEIRAFHNVCTHRGTRLVWDEEGRAGKFSCRYHMWTFGADGALRAVPDADRFVGLDKTTCGLKPIALDRCGGFLFINFSAVPDIGLRSFLGKTGVALERSGLAQCDQFSEYRYDVAANWKITYDNFQEVYHLRWVHERSIGGVSTGPANPFGYPSEYHFDDPHRGMRLWFNPQYAPGPVEADAQTRLAAHNSDKTAETHFYCVFPNLFVFASVGRYFTQQVWPVAPGKTRSVIRLYWTGADSDASERFGREFALASTIDVHSEDRQLIEAGHQGLESGAVEHLQFQSQEILCRHFFHEVDDRVQAYRAESAVVAPE